MAYWTKRLRSSLYPRTMSSAFALRIVRYVCVSLHQILPKIRCNDLSKRICELASHCVFARDVCISSCFYQRKYIIDVAENRETRKSKFLVSESQDKFSTRDQINWKVCFCANDNSHLIVHLRLITLYTINNIPDRNILNTWRLNIKYYTFIYYLIMTYRFCNHEEKCMRNTP